MKKILFAALPIAAIAFALQFTIDPLAIGSPIPNPDAKMKGISGKDISLNEAKEKGGLLVIFSCNTCPVVIKYQDRSNEICKYASGKGIGVALLNSNEAYREKGDSYEDSKEYGKDNGYNWHYLMDDNSKMADAFGATRTPEVFLFNNDGKLVYHGAIDDNGNVDEVTRKHVMIAMDEINSGKEVSLKETRSVGCTIKRKKS